MSDGAQRHDQIMVDIEVLGMRDRARAYLVSVGACAFTYRHGGGINVDSVFHAGLSRRGNEELDRHPDGETVEWWLKQSRDAQQGLLELPRFDSGVELCRAFRDWVHRACDPAARVSVWAKPPSFDLGILSELFAQVDEVWPWIHYQARDVRTLLDLGAYCEVPGLRELVPDIAHRADHDAMAQARQVIAVYQSLAREGAEGDAS